MTWHSLGHICKRAGIGVIVICWPLLLWTMRANDGLGTDFYPIYASGRALLTGGVDPYGPTFTDTLVKTWHVPFAAAGFAYPLPSTIGVWPLALLPLSLAMIIWTLAGTIGTFAAITLRPDWRGLILLPFFFMPLHRAVVVKQATLVWFALVVVLLIAMRQRRSFLAGWCIALLPAKPQVGLLFAVAGLIWAWTTNRRALLWAGVWAAVLWGGSFLIQPTWVQDWLASVARYNSIVHPPNLLPWSLLLIVCTWRLPWYARLAAAQVALFPVSDVYSALPLLLTWVGVGGPLALIGCGLSWLWLFKGIPSTVFVYWLLVITPLLVCSSWRFYQDWQVQHATSAILHE